MIATEMPIAEAILAELRQTCTDPFVLKVAASLAARWLRASRARSWLHVAYEAAAQEGAWLGAVLAQRRGPAEVSRARHRAWSDLVPEASYPVIASLWGRTNHTVILGGVRTHRARVQQQQGIEASCSEPGPWCGKNERAEVHRGLPERCRRSPFEAPGGLCALYREILEWRERMPIEGGWTITPLGGAWGFGAPVHRTKFCRTREQLALFEDARPGRGPHPADEFEWGAA